MLITVHLLLGGNGEGRGREVVAQCGTSDLGGADIPRKHNRNALGAPIARGATMVPVQRALRHRLLRPSPRRLVNLLAHPGRVRPLPLQQLRNRCLAGHAAGNGLRRLPPHGRHRGPSAPQVRGGGEARVVAVLGGGNDVDSGAACLGSGAGEDKRCAAKLGGGVHLRSQLLHHRGHRFRTPALLLVRKALRDRLHDRRSKLEGVSPELLVSRRAVANERSGGCNDCFLSILRLDSRGQIAWNLEAFAEIGMIQIG
mmetsp:Transcript_2949/g.6704  ORF Transcript_2949/g.6704 Transcript_2949/m.6704 type:complete len:256 (+) Transcript_2949:293-1060(+)